MNSEHDYWLSPSAELMHCPKGHREKAGEILNYPFADPDEALLQRGWVRIVTCPVTNNLFFERRSVPTEKQMAAMKDLAIELRCKLDDGRRVIFDPEEVECPL